MKARVAARTVYGLLLTTSLMWIGCSDSGGPAKIPAEVGVFIDSPVEGLAFSAGDESGLTDVTGGFLYTPGSFAAFAVGDIDLGAAVAEPSMSPLNLAPTAVDLNDNEVTSFARFLQTIDDDANATNGITITAAVTAAAAGQSIDFDQDPVAFQTDNNVMSVVNLLTTATSAGARTLIDAAQARGHLRGTLQAANAGTYSGTLGLDTPLGGTIGIWQATAESNGNVTGSYQTNQAPVSFSGSLTETGALSCTATDGVVITGQRSWSAVRGCYYVDGRWATADSSQIGNLVGCME